MPDLFRAALPCPHCGATLTRTPADLRETPARYSCPAQSCGFAVHLPPLEPQRTTWQQLACRIDPYIGEHRPQPPKMREAVVSRLLEATGLVVDPAVEWLEDRVLDPLADRIEPRLPEWRWRAAHTTWRVLNRSRRSLRIALGWIDEKAMAASAWEATARERKDGAL